MKFIIPARKGSKGFPLKNRKIFKYTAETLGSCKNDVIVSSDDEAIGEMAEGYGFSFHCRSDANSADTTPIKDVMLEVVRGCKIFQDEVIVMLYLTYPGRSYNDIKAAIDFFNKNQCKSMLCSKEVDISPYHMFFKNGYKGEQVIKHDLYRRQDYRECIQLSHFVCIFKCSELKNLNNNLYNKHTLYMPLNVKEIADIDDAGDLERFLKYKDEDHS